MSQVCYHVCHSRCHISVLLICFQKTLQNVRQSSQQHQHPQTAQQAGFGKFIVIVAPFVVAGGAITYAK